MDVISICSPTEKSRTRSGARPEWYDSVSNCLRAAHDRSRFLGLGLFRCSFPGSFSSSRTRAASRIQIKLAHFVEQSFVTDAQHLGGILAAPIRLLQSGGDGFHFCFVLQTTDERLDAHLFPHPRSLTRSEALLLTVHFKQLAKTAFVIFENHVTFDKVFQFAEIARPGIAQCGFDQMLRRIRSSFLIFLAVLHQEVAEPQGSLRG